MPAQPASAKITGLQTVEIFDQNGNYMHRVSVAPDRVAGAVVSGGMLTINLTDGRVKGFALIPGSSPVLRFTR